MLQKVHNSNKWRRTYLYVEDVNAALEASYAMLKEVFANALKASSLQLPEGQPADMPNQASEAKATAAAAAAGLMDLPTWRAWMKQSGLYNIVRGHAGGRGGSQCTDDLDASHNSVSTVVAALHPKDRSGGIHTLPHACQR